MTKKITIGLFALYLVSTGCKKDLDLAPTDSVTGDVAYNSIAALQKGLNTVYATYGGARVGTMLANSVTSDEVKFGPQNGGSNQFGYRLQYTSDATTSSEVTDLIYGYGSLIDRINRVLEASENVPANDATETASKNYIKAQLLALRAMGHFELLEAYSKRYDAADPLGIPITLTSCLTCQPSRSTVAESIAQVEKDLTDAKDLMPTVTAATFTDLALNRISVTAYQARVALYKREWQKASDLATTVIASGIKPLVSGTAFSGIWTDANTNEILFRVRYENSATIGAQWNNGGITFSPSDKLTATYAANDIRATAYIGTTSVGRFVKKFSSSARGANIVDLKAIRTVEMYLIRAEARAELNDLAGAAADINFIRSMRITSPTPVSYADKNAAITDILLERYKELAFEGFRFFDLKRRGLPLQRNASDVDSPLWQTLAADNYRFVYPIANDELLANRNMVQNPGY